MKDLGEIGENQHKIRIDMEEEYKVPMIMLESNKINYQNKSILNITLER